MIQWRRKSFSLRRPRRNLFQWYLHPISANKSIITKGKAPKFPQTRLKPSIFHHTWVIQWKKKKVEAKKTAKSRVNLKKEGREQNSYIIVAKSSFLRRFTIFLLKKNRTLLLNFPKSIKLFARVKKLRKYLLLTLLCIPSSLISLKTY